MITTKRCIFRYDRSKPAWHNHIKMIAHDGLECTASFVIDEEVGEIDYEPQEGVYIRFDDGYEVSVYFYELEEVT